MKIFVNALTISRIIGSFLFPLIWFTDNPVIIIIYAIFLMLTDSLDGFLARKFKCQTLFGMMFDTIADKFLGVILLFLIATKYKIFIALIVFEVIIAFVNVFASAGDANTHSSLLGKVKTWALGLSILVALILMMPYLPLPELITNNEEKIIIATLFIAVGSEFIVLSDYLIQYGRDLKGTKVDLNYDIKSKEELKYILFDTDYIMKNKNKTLLHHLTVKRKKKIKAR